MSTARWRRSAALLALALWLCGCDDDSEVTEVSDSGGDVDAATNDILDEEETGDRPEVVISSGDVAELYEVVSSADYEGYRVVLEPGVYELERALDPGNLGTVVLQSDMEVIGSNEYRDYEDALGNPVEDGVWDPWDASVDEDQFANPETETILDCTRVNPPSFAVTDCAEDPTTGSLAPSCISLGPGNRLSRVTVVGSQWFNGSLVQYRPDSRDSTASADGARSGEISDCVVEGGGNAVSAGLASCPAEGLEADVTIARNVLRHGDSDGVFLWGGLFTRDVTLRATLRDNRIEGNHLFGVIAYAGVSADRCELDVASSNNIVRHNDVGGAFLVGFVDYPFVQYPPGGVDNRLSWTSRGDWIIGNGLMDVPETEGGVLVWGVYLHTPALPEVARNGAEVRFFDTAFASGGDVENWSNQFDRADVTAVGHYGLTGNVVFPHNTVLLELEGCRSDGTPVYFDHSVPDDPEGTNRVTIVGGAESLESNNEGIPGAVEVEYGGI